MTAFDCMYVCAPYKCLVTSKVRKKVLDPLGLGLLHPFSGQRPQGQLEKKIYWAPHPALHFEPRWGIHEQSTTHKKSNLVKLRGKGTRATMVFMRRKGLGQTEWGCMSPGEGLLHKCSTTEFHPLPSSPLLTKVSTSFTIQRHSSFPSARRCNAPQVSQMFMTFGEKILEHRSCLMLTVPWLGCHYSCSNWSLSVLVPSLSLTFV